MLRELITSMRPQQWYKNIVLFIGIIFSRNFFNHSMWLPSILGFVVFCLVSGGVYIINDIVDIEKDKHHPSKRDRPIASGKLKITPALIAAILIVLVAFLVSLLLNKYFLLSVFVYFVLSVLYSLLLKNIIILDMIVISSGFVIRAIAGCLSISVSISPWLILCAFLLAFFLVLGKRRSELTLLEKNYSNHRKTKYTKELLEQMMTITISSLFLSYSLYTFFTGGYLLMFTIPFMAYGIFRYLYLIHDKNFGGNPEYLFKDKGICTAFILWLIVSIILFNIK